MDSVSIEKSAVVWVVSFGLTAVDEAQDYQIEEIDLTDKPAKTVELLQEKLGDGVFVSYEAAAQWIAVKQAPNTHCCQDKQTAGNSSCCCPQGQACNNKSLAVKREME